MEIILDFNHFKIEAKLFDHPVAQKLVPVLPVTVSLTTWGREAYGPIKDNLGDHKPVPRIPAGGIAYTNQGNYICLFYGQDPAWSVEYIGQMKEGEWQQLIHHNPATVTILRK